MRHYPNVVNRKRQVLRSDYYASKVNHLRQTRPSQWWSAVKWIAGMALALGLDSLFANLKIEGSALLSEEEIAKQINSASLQPMESFQGLNLSHHTMRICHR